jgi:thiamine pyrophosphate-dependent acetolactate synthase large subunit-like protein
VDALHSPVFVKVAEAFGAVGLRIEKEAECRTGA